MDELTHRYLLESVRYDPDSGKFFWRDRPRDHFKTSQGYGTWRSKCLGKEAGFATTHGYQKLCINGVSYFAHRVAWFYVYGVWPTNFIDHIDGDAGNNRISNLRDVHHLDDQRNARQSKRNKSGASGVFLSKWNTWQATIWDDGKAIWLGSFQSKSKAIAARKRAEKELGYHPNHGRAA